MAKRATRVAQGGKRDVLAKLHNQADAEAAEAAAWSDPASLAAALTKGKYSVPPHIALMSSALAECATHGGRRLIVTMPPRSGKSELCSLWTPAWYLAVYPERKVILCSYEADFAAWWGRRVRNLLGEYAAYLGVQISDDSAAAHRWETTVGGGMVTAGVGGPVTGRGGDYVVVDDPIKNAQEADSVVIRDNIWDWWRTTLYTRLEPGASIVLVMTRWHEDDLTGRVLNEAANGGEQWHRIDFPAVAEADDVLGRKPGEALWPERFDVAALERIRRTVGSRGWSALYQQRPSPAGGDVFRRAWFRYYRRGEGGMYRIGAHEPSGSGARDVLDRQCVDRFLTCDLALSEKQSADWTVLAAWVVTAGGELVLVDLERVQESSVAVQKRIEAMAARNRAVWIGVEYAHYGMAVVQAFRARGVPVRALRPDRDKVSRARVAAVAMENGRVVFPQEAQWLDGLETELLSFPNAAHDDFCLTSHTCISTMDGWKPIIDIKAGDMVWTRRGLRRVLWSGQTGVSKTIRRLGIEATPNHPVWTENRGWVQIQFVKPSDVLVCVGNPLCSPGEPTTDIQMPSGMQSECTFIRMVRGAVRRAHCIVTYGKHVAVRFPQGIIFTTRMDGTTIASAFWNWRLRWSMVANTGSRWNCSSAKKDTSIHPRRTPLRCSADALRKKPKPPDGTQQPKRPIWPRLIGWFRARIAACRFAPLHIANTSDAKNALISGDIFGDTSTILGNQGISSVHGAQLFFSRLASVAGFVHPRAGTPPQCRDSEIAVPVYNLTVEGAHEYFANGILVHNCDAVSYACLEVSGVGADRVMSQYDPARHRVEAFELPGDWPRFRAYQPGEGVPGVCVWAALSPAGWNDQKGRCFVVYRELALESAAPAAVVKAITAASSGGDERYAGELLLPPSSSLTGKANERTLADELEAAGLDSMWWPASQASGEPARLDVVRGLLDAGRLLVMDCCERVDRELRTWGRSETTGKPDGRMTAALAVVGLCSADVEDMVGDAMVLESDMETGVHGVAERVESDAWLARYVEQRRNSGTGGVRRGEGGPDSEAGIVDMEDSVRW